MRNSGFYRASKNNNNKRLLKSIGLLEFDKTSALQAGIIQAKLMKIGKPIDPYDVLIAGIVMANDEELLTRDDHFIRIPGLRCRSW